MALNLDIAKTWLRVEHDADDAIIQILIPASKSFAESYLNRSLDDFEGGYPEEFDVAMLYVVQQWYDQKAITTFSKSEENGLGFAFSLILDRHRFRQFTFLGYPKLNADNMEFSYEVTSSDAVYFKDLNAQNEDDK